MSEDAKVLLYLFGLIISFAIVGTLYFAWQDWLLADIAKKALEAQKEIAKSLPEECLKCPHCKLKKEEGR